MAAKAPVKKAQPKKSPVKASKAKAKTRYTKAQRQAYNAASKAAIARAVIAKRAAVAKTRSIQNAKGVQQRRNIKAARSKALPGRSGKRQRPASGIQAIIRMRSQAAQAAGYARRTQTLTFQQAAFISGLATYIANKKAYARLLARKKLRKPPKRVPKKSKTPRRPSQFGGIGSRAGSAAAKRVPPSQKAAPAKKKAVSKTRKAPIVTPAVNPEWITAGNDRGVENCVAVAIANHLLLHTGHRITDDELNFLIYRDSVWKALCALDYSSWKGIGLSEYGMVDPEDAEPGMIVGFETPLGSHCAVLMPGNKVISWGEIIPLESEIDEAWQVTWTVTSR